MWRGESPIAGAPEAIEALRSANKRVVFVTNNASRSPRDFAAKLMRLRVPTEPNDVITSAHAVISYLFEIGLRRGTRVHVCGTDALAQFLRSSGFETTKASDDVAAVVVAWNPALVMDDIRRAADAARSGIPFIGANRDATYPDEHGLLPGSGAILAAVETASGRIATVVGKPQPELFRLALIRAGSQAQRTLMVGDRADSDVVGAHAAGIPVALVLTGVTSSEEAPTVEPRPDWVVQDLAAIFETDPSGLSVEGSPAEPVVVGPVEPVVGENAAPGTATPEREDEEHPREESADVGPERDAAPTLFDP